MENPLTQLPPDHRLGRKEVLYLLKWSRTTLWRRERDGLRFVHREIEVRELREWLERREPRPAAELVTA
jgi:hypothetical protein